MNLTGKIRIVAVNRITRAEMFVNLVAGDVLALSQPFLYPGTRKIGVYATYLTITCERTREHVKLSLSGVHQRLKAFQWENFEEQEPKELPEFFRVCSCVMPPDYAALGVPNNQDIDVQLSHIDWAASKLPHKLKTIRAVLTGETRVPRSGEWYLNGTSAYRAVKFTAMTEPYPIAKLVITESTRTIDMQIVKEMPDPVQGDVE